jgi:uncharacterized membrane protein
MTDQDRPPQRIWHLQRYLITGLLTLFPLWLTWAVFRFVFNALSGVSAPWVHSVLDGLATDNPTALGWFAAPWVQSTLAVVSTLIVIYLVGFAANRVLGQRLIEAFEALIVRIPLAQQIYGGAKKLLDVMQTKPGGGQRVVLIEFPGPGLKAVGFLTRMFRDEHSGVEYAAVYVPTTPNPTGGYLEIVPAAELIPTDWSVDQAMAFILSGGALGPDPVTFSRQAELRAAIDGGK